MALDLGLHGKVVVVTGAGGGGIGTATCALLADAGASVAAVDLNEAALAPTEKAVSDRGGLIAPLVADVTSESGVEQAVEQAVQRLGPLYGLVNVVGNTSRTDFAPATATSKVAFERILQQNLVCAWLTARAVGTKLVQQQTPGSLVLISSVAGVMCQPYNVSYAAAKAAVDAMARTLAAEWGPRGIRVNSVAPSGIRTPTAFGDQETLSPATQAAIPLGRRGAPENVGGAILFLLSELSAYITGQVLLVDGGVSIRPGYLGEQNMPGWGPGEPPSS